MRKVIPHDDRNNDGGQVDFWGQMDGFGNSSTMIGFLEDDDFVFPSSFQEVTKEDYFRLKKRRKTATELHYEDEKGRAASVNDSEPKKEQETPTKTEKAGVRENQPVPITPKSTDYVLPNESISLSSTIVVSPCRSSTPATVSSSSPASRLEDDSSSSSKPPTGGKLLPPGFEPDAWSVIIGRDKASLHSTGNRRLRLVVNSHMEKYATYRHGKIAKTQIISDIERTIRDACGDPTTAFITKDGDNHQWRIASSSMAREKISRLLRESLHTKYSSSSRRKRARRKLSLVNPTTTKA